MTDAARVVVGVDGSGPSRRALAWAGRLARTSGASLDVVLSWQRPLADGDAGDPTERLRAFLATVTDHVLGAERPARVTLTVCEGPPARVLLERSRDAALLVVGSRGHSGLQNLLMGSVSARCTFSARCPVLVVPVPAAPGAGDR